MDNCTNNYKEAICRLHNNEWVNMTNEQKIAILQTVENQMAINEKRLPCEVSSRYIPSNENGMVLGYYTDSDKMITINSEQLDEGSMYGNDYKVHIDTVIHEGRHAYQHQAVDGIIEHDNKEEVAEWKNNFDNYIRYDKNPKRYFEQPVEVDARQYAAEKSVEVVSDIKNVRVNDYSGNTNTSNNNSNESNRFISNNNGMSY